MVKGYCFRCKKNIKMNNPVEEIRKGRKFIIGNCPVCNGRVYSARGQVKEDKDIQFQPTPIQQPTFQPEPFQPEQSTIENPEIIKNWNRNAKPFNKQIVNKDFYTLIKIALIGLGIFCIVLLLLIYNGYTTDKISCPNMTCPPCPENVPCPNSECAVTCGDCNFPSDLNLNINNETS